MNTNSNAYNYQENSPMVEQPPHVMNMIMTRYIPV